MSLAIAAFTIVGLQAQENKILKTESTIKRVTTKEGSNVNVKEIKSTDTESGAVIVEGNLKTNQEFNENTKKNLENEVLVDNIDIDKLNESAIVQLKENQLAELEASRKYQEVLAAKKKQEYIEKQMQMKKDLAARQESLQARPKGMSKLKKN